MLSACLIVKNEEACLQRCLDSIKDLVEEIIIVDTGSKDNTKDIARKYTDAVFDFEWCNDFSAARNFALSQTTHEWILSIDADETISPQDHQKIREAIKTSHIDGYIMIKRNYTHNPMKRGVIRTSNDTYPESKDYYGYVPAPAILLFRRGYTFSGVVHELVLGVKKIGKTDIPIHHFGNESEEHQKRKSLFYADLCRQKAEMNDTKGMFELGVTLSVIEDWESAKNAFEKLASIEPAYPGVQTRLVQIYGELGAYEKAIQSYQKAVTLNPRDVQAHMSLAALFVKRKLFSSAEKIYRRLLSENRQNFGAALGLAICFIETGKRDGAKEICEAIIARDPKNPLAQNLLKKISE